MVGCSACCLSMMTRVKEDSIVLKRAHLSQFLSKQSSVSHQLLPLNFCQVIFRVSAEKIMNILVIKNIFDLVFFSMVAVSLKRLS